MQFDPKISMGNVLTILSMAAAVSIAYGDVKTDVAVIKEAQASAKNVTTNDVTLLRADIQRVETKVDRLIERQR